MSWWDPSDADEKNQKARNDLKNQTEQDSTFGSTLQTGLDQYNQGLNQQMGYLQNTMNGGNSVSAEQLRQGLGQQLAQQQSMAAGASPQNAAMAARTAANNMQRASYGMAGQQALAGIQERNQAAQTLGGELLNARGQNISGANQAYGTATQGASVPVGTPQQSFWAQAAPVLNAGAAGIGIAATKSDERAKKDIKPAGKKVGAILDAINAVSYKYKDPKDGKGEQFGLTAQALEKAGLKSAVIDTPNGKYVHSGKAALAALAAVAELHHQMKGGKK